MTTATKTRPEPVATPTKRIDLPFQVVANLLTQRNVPMNSAEDLLLERWRASAFNDMANFVTVLLDRNAVINIPKYASNTLGTKVQNELLTSPENRHGRIIGLFSNQDTFSFGVKIMDANIMTSSEVGAPRNFLMVGHDGFDYDGCRDIVFFPLDQEKALMEKNAASSNSLSFKHFVHPDRWADIYSETYILTKMFIARIKEECRFLRKFSKSFFVSDSVKFPAVTTRQAKMVKKKVTAFNAEVDMEFTGEFVAPLTLENTVNKIAKLRSRLTQLQFFVRATELAFFRNGSSGKTPPDKKIVWETGFKLPGKRILWNRATIHGQSLRFRTWEKTITVRDHS